eukprot:TRINITY_DN27609_c0_g1_i1.p1 TRINITY_DN27609_c0_g1~~TRINITY_DN27609_c0_g1_i1.p1  ORF type:complete len:484 (+),score=84.34 TRINITY_DN27609_c0_g1_i1:24-1454(+)
MRRVSILTINDVYETQAADGLGGFAEISTLLQRQRKALEDEGVYTLVTVNGDFLAASVAAIRSEGESAVALLEHLNTDIVVLGNHEFDFGQAVLEQRIAGSHFIWLGSNVVDKSSGKQLAGVHDTYILEVAAEGGAAPLRLGFFGVCTEMTPQLSDPGDGVEFRDIFEASRRAVAALHSQDVDCVIAVTHVSIAQDVQLARQVLGIDVVLGGHDHSPYAQLHDDTLILKCGQNAQYLGRVDLFIEKQQETLVWKQWQLLINRYQPADAACREIVKKWDALALERDELVVTIVSPGAYTLDTRTSVVRSRPAAFGSLVAECMRQAVGADLGIINGGFIRGDRRYPLNGSSAYPWMMSDMQRELPWFMPVGLAELTGEALLGCVQQMISKSGGAYPHLSSTEFPAPAPFEAGHVRVHGQPVDPKRVYRVATTEFLLNGGDGIDFSTAKLLNEYATAPALPSLVEAYFRRSPSVSLDRK